MHYISTYNMKDVFHLQLYTLANIISMHALCHIMFQLFSEEKFDVAMCSNVYLFILWQEGRVMR